MIGSCQPCRRTCDPWWDVTRRSPSSRPPSGCPTPRTARCCWPATPASARPGCSPSCCDRAAGAGWQVARRATASTSATAPCPTCRSARSSAGSPPTSPAVADDLLADPPRHRAAAAGPPDAGRRHRRRRRTASTAASSSSRCTPPSAGSRATAPLLVVIEDVHWADQSTRDLLSFLFARGFDAPGRGRRVLPQRRPAPAPPAARRGRRVGPAARVDAPRSSTPLRRRRRARARARRCTPARCRSSEVRGDRRARRGQRVLRRGARRRGRAGRRTLPGDLADLLLVRLDRLDERRPRRGARRVGGRPPGVARAARRASPASTATELDAAPARGRRRATCWSPSADGCYAFRHALLAEAVYDDLLPGERVRLHAAYVAALGSGDLPGTAAELARHARAAHDLPDRAARQHPGRRRGDGRRRARRGRAALRGRARAAAGDRTRRLPRLGRPDRPGQHRRRDGRAPDPGDRPGPARPRRAPARRPGRGPGPPARAVRSPVGAQRLRIRPLRRHHRGARPAPRAADRAARRAAEPARPRLLRAGPVRRGRPVGGGGAADRAGPGPARRREPRPHHPGPPRPARRRPGRCAALPREDPRRRPLVERPGRRAARPLQPGRHVLRARPADRGPCDVRGDAPARRGRRPAVGPLRPRRPDDDRAGRLRRGRLGRPRGSARRLRSGAAAGGGGAPGRHRHPGARGSRRAERAGAGRRPRALVAARRPGGHPERGRRDRQRARRRRPVRRHHDLRRRHRALSPACGASRHSWPRSASWGSCSPGSGRRRRGRAPASSRTSPSAGPVSRPTPPRPWPAARSCTCCSGPRAWRGRAGSTPSWPGCAG